MHAKPRAFIEHMLYAYAAAVAVAVVVFCAGLGLWIHTYAQCATTGSGGIVDILMSTLVLYLIALFVAIPPAILGGLLVRHSGIRHPIWFAVYGALIAMLLASILGASAAGSVLPMIAGASAGTTFRAFLPKKASIAETRRKPA